MAGEVRLVMAAALPPGACGICGRNQGPLVDTQVATSRGRLYVCSSTCVPTLAVLCGFEHEEKARQLEDDLREAETLVRVLQIELEARAEELKVLGWLRDRGLVAAVNGEHPPEDEPEDEEEEPEEEKPALDMPILDDEMTLDVAPTCNAIRADGTPCTAKAVPGRELCIAHIRYGARERV